MSDIEICENSRLQRNTHSFFEKGPPSIVTFLDFLCNFSFLPRESGFILFIDELEKESGSVWSIFSLFRDVHAWREYSFDTDLSGPRRDL